MKILRIMTVIAVAVIISIPLFKFNFTPEAISMIDNRVLAGNPLEAEGDLTNNIENYINDRIGLRDKMITAYTVLNDKLFGKMVHPSYVYGKDGYVFGAGLTTSNDFGEYHVVFADMVAAIQNYCEERGVPFLFVFNPAKPAIYQDKIANGVNYNREWVELFFEELEKRNINYLDNTDTLLEISSNGIEGFNQKYDANHWNDLGAFYGTQKMLERLKENCPTVHVNVIDEFDVSETLETSLLVSEFPINEYVPTLSIRASCDNMNEEYFSEIDIHSSYQGFGYWINEERSGEETPRALVFQGSYMNGYGYKYMLNAFEEYILIHDYQNVINFPYYFNIFQPECVVFEVAEYTFSDTYFNYENMCAIDYNPNLAELDESEYCSVEVDEKDIIVEQGETLTKIIWATEDEYSYVWMKMDNIYDMQKVESGYQVTIETERFEGSEENMEIVVSSVL